MIASDCGLPGLAHDLCWLHINVYRAVPRPLAVLEARYMLEPVLNLARLQLRASDGEQALRLLTTMHQAATTNADLEVEGRTLPLADLVGTRQEHHRLREWVWLHLLSDGIRALTLAGRWHDAVAHANAHRGIGLHLMEGRQALIVAHCLNQDVETARAVLAESTPEQPWELQIAACLKVMCIEVGRTPASSDIAPMIKQFAQQRPAPGYAAFRAQLGLTITTLASIADPTAARHILSQVADEAIRSRDGYAARAVLHYDEVSAHFSSQQGEALTDLLTSSGLGAGTMPEPLLDSLYASTQTAASVLSTWLSEPTSNWINKAGSR